MSELKINVETQGEALKGVEDDFDDVFFSLSFFSLFPFPFRFPFFFILTLNINNQ